MTFPGSASLVVALVAALAGCSDDEEATDPDTLFESLPPPTPNKLRGVYRTTVEEPGVNVDIRLRFGAGFVVGGVRCTPTAPGASTVAASGKVDALTSELDAAIGKVTLPTSLQMKALTPPPSTCEAALRSATYDFKVEDLTLRLLMPDQALSSALVYTKIGD